MSKLNHSSHGKSRIRIHTSFVVALSLLTLHSVRAAPLSVSASTAPAQKVIVVGVLPFQDETDSGAPAELGKKIAQQLKQRLSLSFKDVLPKTLNSDAATPLNVEQLVGLGKQNAVQFVIRGGILTLAATDSNVTAQLYAEIISVESGGSSVVRAEGTSVGGSIQWSGIDLNSASFPSSATGKALAAAIDQLATSVHNALLSPVAEASPTEVSPAETSTDSGETTESTTPADAAAADADEELQQLIAQAEEVVANGSGDANSLQSVSSGLQKVKAALTSKASLIQGGGDPTSGDQEVAAAKSELQSALTTLNEQAAASSTSSEEVTEPTGEKKSLLSSIDQRASEALGLLQKIQEMRAAFQGLKGNTNVGDASEGSGQPTEDVSGVVMEDGQPLEGVEVIDKDSKVTAITAPDGSYTLKSLKAGKLSNLVLKKNGKQLAAGQVALLRGRPAVADFEIKRNASPSASTMRVIPSTTMLKRNPGKGPTGTLKGTARDQSGKALARALVSLKGLAMARTDSQGRYVFLNVPAGEHVVTVQKSGSRPMSTRVLVKPNTSAETQTQLTSVPRSAVRSGQQPVARGNTSSTSPAAGGVNPIVISRDRALGNGQTASSGGALKGQVIDGSNRRPIAGATVTIAGRRSKTDQAGNYEFADLTPGTYQVKVTITGFSEDQQSTSIRAGAASREDFALKRVGDSNRTVHLPTEAPRVVTAVRFGQVRGRVIDAASGAPIAGAIVAVSGGQTVVTGRDGSYSLNALTPGSYQVIVRKPGFADRRGEFKIRAGEVSTGNFGLNSNPRKPGR
ncbi:MAG: carboxypeptidase regulatory-like domain-containing protein [Pyrinomonadaceae bacterium]|nr:carboxypeptidase regulatory-like domain-containing protein [Pyrinomonadaceae bacterium]